MNERMKENAFIVSVLLSHSGANIKLTILGHLFSFVQEIRHECQF